MSNNVPVMMAKTMETVKVATGIDLEEIVRGDSFDAKTTRHINFTGIPREKAEELTEIIE